VFVCSAYAEDRSANCAAKQKVFTLPVGTAQTIIALSSGTTATSTVSVSTSGMASTISTASPSTTSAVAEPSKKNNTLAIAVGAGVGGAIGLAAILFAIWSFCIRRRKNKAASRYSTPDSMAKEPTTCVDPYVPPAALPLSEVSRPLPLQPPVERTATTETREPIGRDRYTLFDDGETEIASGNLRGVASASSLGVGRAYGGSGVDEVPATTMPPHQEHTSMTMGRL
jgi:hypothetical protein